MRCHACKPSGRFENQWHLFVSIDSHPLLPISQLESLHLEPNITFEFLTLLLFNDSPDFGATRTERVFLSPPFALYLLFIVRVKICQEGARFTGHHSVCDSLPVFTRAHLKVLRLDVLVERKQRVTEDWLLKDARSVCVRIGWTGFVLRWI